METAGFYSALKKKLIESEPTVMMPQASSNRPPTLPPPARNTTTGDAEPLDRRTLPGYTSAAAENRGPAAVGLKDVPDLAKDIFSEVEKAYEQYEAEKDSTEQADRIEESKRFIADLEAQLADQRRALDALIAQGTATDRVRAKLGAAEITVQGL
jgi:hypothetical protein